MTLLFLICEPADYHISPAVPREEKAPKMEVVARVIKIQLPNYLRSLPIPSTFSGFLKLSGGEWVKLVPFVVTTSVVVYLAISALMPSKPKKGEDWVNKTEQKEKEKVADVFQIEDLGDSTVYCRCWKSKKVCAYTFYLLPESKCSFIQSIDLIHKWRTRG